MLIKRTALSLCIKKALILFFFYRSLTFALFYFIFHYVICLQYPLYSRSHVMLV